MKVGRRVLLGGAGLLALGVGGLTGRRMWLSREPELPAPIDGNGRALWSNWAGNAYAYPAARAAPANEAELAALLPKTQAPIRPVGSGITLAERRRSVRSLETAPLAPDLVVPEAALP